MPDFFFLASPSSPKLLLLQSIPSYHLPLGPGPDPTDILFISMFLLLAPPRLCLGSSPRPKSHMPSTDCSRPRRTCPRVLGHRSDSILHGLTYRISGIGNWRSCPVSTKFPRTAVRNSSCRRLTNATSFLISTTRLPI